MEIYDMVRNKQKERYRYQDEEDAEDDKANREEREPDNK